MRAHSLLRLGLAMALAAFVLPVANEALKLTEGGSLHVWTGRLLQVSAVVLSIALLLWVLEKTGLRVSGARCLDCRRRIPYGHALCNDHLRDRADAARADHHDVRGMGV